ncbi:hypothetical protein ACH5RR_034118 [Cinchona calisaya]|uniref:Protein kinase domain-containing protein n=1 Tax=Cinchona calisaya TaxID=153742 RepID=A0ABD2YCZ2_9GENT
MNQGDKVSMSTSRHQTSFLMLETFCFRSYNAKISGFGIAKIDRPNDFDDIHTNCFNTSVYAAPEYTGTFNLHMKSDVYGFGVVLVETLTGLSAKGRYHLRKLRECPLVDLFRFCFSDRRWFKNMMDPQLKGKYTLKAAVQISQLALTCLHPEPKGRPSMKEVVEKLESNESGKENPKI